MLKRKRQLLKYHSINTNGLKYSKMYISGKSLNRDVNKEIAENK